ncbi:MAG: hypothetical protein WD294_14890 [Phycisphaeraceae bacterium]
MFVLTCPSCNHAARVKFVRLNALATCPACNARFRVDTQSASIDRDGQVGGPLHNLPQQVPPPETLAVRGKLNPAAFAGQADPDEPSTEEIWDEMFGEAPTPVPTVHEAPLDWKPRPSALELPDGIRLEAVGLLMVASAVAAALLVGVIMNGSRERPETVVQVPPELVAEEPSSDGDGTQEPTGGNGSGQTAGGGEGGTAGGDDNSETGAEGSDVVVVDEPTEPRDELPPLMSGEGSGGLPLAPRVPPPGYDSDLPRMRLDGSVAYEPRWEALSEPRRAMQPMIRSDVLVWMPRLQHDQENDRTMFTAMFLAETDRIYQSGFLHVQLLNEEGLAIAELKQVVPAVNARQGLQVRLKVPNDLDYESSSVVAQFTPVDPVMRAVPIEAMEAETRVQYSGEGPAIEITVMNPNREPVIDPIVVVDLLTADGWPVGMYRGTVSGRIEAGEQMTFVVRPPVENEADPGRIQIRGYAFRDD